MEPQSHSFFKFLKEKRKVKIFRKTISINFKFVVFVIGGFIFVFSVMALVLM